MDRRPLAMAEWAPLGERVELSLIFMVAAAFGQVVLASRGLTTAAEIVVPVASGVMFSILWVVPKPRLGNIVRAVSIFLAWSVLSTGISDQVSDLMLSPAARHEVSSR